MLSLERKSINSFFITKSKEKCRPAWYICWEIYPILIIATFLRFYRVDTSEFDLDQVTMYRLAYDAVHHGLWPVTNSTASLGFANAPGEIYLLMIPATFSANPLYGTYLVSLLASLSVLITYIFTIRYFGRLAGTIAAGLYATAAIPLSYSRFLWQPNFMYVFVISFFLALFVGVVERRKGWFGPAVILLGILYQTHGTILTLAVPLVLAVFLAPKTVRGRDILYGLAGLIVIFFPFLLWFLYTRFSDLSIILAQNNQPAVFNSDAWTLYRLLLSPYDINTPLPDSRSFVYALAPITAFLYRSVFYLFLAGLVLIVGKAGYGCLSGWRQERDTYRDNEFDENRRYGRPLKRIFHLWRSIPPETGGLMLLLIWQIVPIAALLKHSVFLYPHYILVVVPGPFIIISYLLVEVGRRVYLTRAPLWSALRGTILIAMTCVIVLQLVNSVATIRDRTHGYFVAKDEHQYYNDLYTLQKIFDRAEHYHLKRTLIGVDKQTQAMMFYLSEHYQPAGKPQASVFFFDQCLLLPAPQDGPAALIMPPYASPEAYQRITALGGHLLEQVEHLGGEPFRIYQLPATADRSAVTDPDRLTNELGSPIARYLDQENTVASRWRFLHQQSSATNVTYSYHFTAWLNNQPNQKRESSCVLNTAQSGDQLVPFFSFSHSQGSTIAGTSLTMQVQTFTTTPDYPYYGPFHLETHRRFDSKPVILHTLNGQDQITVPIM